MDEDKDIQLETDTDVEAHVRPGKTPKVDDTSSQAVEAAEDPTMQPDGAVKRGLGIRIPR